jgi:hypothetical protein
LDEAAFAMTPTARLAREAEAAARASEALANVRLNQPFQATTLAAPEPSMPEAVPVVEEAPIAPVAAAPAAPSAPARPVTPFDQDRERVVALPPTQRVQAARQQARQALLASNGTATLRQVREAEQQAGEAAMKVQSQKRRYTDPLTKHVLEYDVDVDGLGNVVRVAEPTVASYDPVTLEVDKNFAKQYEEWTSKGAPETASNTLKLDRAINMLLDPNGPQISGPLVGTWEQVPGLGKITTRALAPEMKNVRDDVLTVGQGMIRQVFGANPAQAEAQRLLDRMFDPTASEEENARRVAIFRNAMVEGAQIQQARSKFFEKNRTMAGYGGPDFDQLRAGMAQDLAASDPKTSQKAATQQAVSTATAKAQQAAYDYLAKRRAAPAQ